MVSPDRRYYTLDGLRGVAAIIVMMGHTRDFLLPMTPPRMWLAVDMFFLLSGFVLGGVYEPRFRNGMTPATFMFHRMTRLYPLWILGFALVTASTATVYVLGKGQASGDQLMVAIFSGSLLLPTPMPYGLESIIPLNPPGWSLFFELFVNLFYVACFSFLASRRNLLIVIVISAVALMLQYMHGHEAGGDRWTNFWWGFPRVGFSFFLGVYLQRIHDGKSIKTNFAWLVPLALVPLIFGRYPHELIVNFLTVTIAFPALIFIGATLEPRNTKLFTILGSSSYAVYALHGPILDFVWRLMIFLHAMPRNYAPMIGVIFCASVFALAVAADRYYDAPVRKIITAKLKYGSAIGRRSNAVG